MRKLAWWALASCMAFGIARADPGGTPLVVSKTKDCGSFTMMQDAETGDLDTVLR